ncbi:MAG: response regulator transcription factor [Microscillaceae bacterium]|jgi:DNA-binding NarL/FixJ family response regulator|nr:response regulator transcription factor [Microscillaceae bacterium]
MENKIKIVHYEDNNHLREGMVFLMNATPNLDLVGSFRDCMQLENQIKTLKPDVVLMDIDMPGRNGIEAVKILKEIAPQTQVLMLTVFEDEDKIFATIRNGASGYLLKNTSPTEIIEAIFDIYNGGSPMTASIARKVLSFFQQQNKLTKTDYKLSERENDILKGLVKGYSYKLIADELFISIDTVRTHIRHVYDKLQVNSKSEAILKALREGLV